MIVYRLNSWIIWDGWGTEFSVFCDPTLSPHVEPHTMWHIYTGWLYLYWLIKGMKLWIYYTPNVEYIVWLPVLKIRPWVDIWVRYAVGWMSNLNGFCLCIYVVILWVLIVIISSYYHYISFHLFCLFFGMKPTQTYL